MADLMGYIVEQTKELLKNADEKIIKEMSKHIHEYLMYEYDDVGEIERAIWDYIKTQNRR